MVCGKVAAGKTTLCWALGQEPGTIVVAQDHWMSNLYPEELRTVADYIRLVPRLHAAMGPHIVDLLRADVSVVLDWPANTIKSRAWMRSLFEAAGADHRLHVLDVPDAVCLGRLRARNAEGTHPFNVSEDEFVELTGYFEVPLAAEGFDLVIHPSSR